MDNIEAIKFVREKLLKQGAKSQNSEQCLFRSGTKRCAIGWLIPDEEYQDTFETDNFDLVIEKVWELQSIDRRVLDHLMDIHDDRPVSEWASALDDLAVKYA